MILEPGIEYLGRRLDDIQREATHNRLMATVLQAEMRSSHAKLDAVVAEMQAKRARIDVIDDRMARIEGQLDRIISALESRS